MTFFQDFYKYNVTVFVTSNTILQKEHIFFARFEMFFCSSRMSKNRAFYIRFVFQTMKDCWRCKILAVEATRLDLEMRKKQKRVREELTLSIRRVNNMVRTLRKSDRNADDLLHLEPLDQRALRVEIAAAESERASHYFACRRLRRSGVVFRARHDRLERKLLQLTEGVRGTVISLERMMAELRKQLSLSRIQERIFQQEAVDIEQKGLNARRRLVVVNEQLALLRRHPYKVHTVCHFS